MASATRTVRILALVVALAGVAAAQEIAQKSSTKYSAESARTGRKAYLRLCQYCHGQDGRAQANPDFDAPNLRRPEEWRNGTSDERLFLSIKEGFGHDMPPFKSKLNDQEIWQVVHFVRSIGPENYRGQPSE